MELRSAIASPEAAPAESATDDSLPRPDVRQGADSHCLPYPETSARTHRESLREAGRTLPHSGSACGSA